eukprot:scaffold50797_cov19-Tisochrysis_lutea.AAC.2
MLAVVWAEKPTTLAGAYTSGSRVFKKLATSTLFPVPAMQQLQECQKRVGLPSIATHNAKSSNVQCAQATKNSLHLHGVYNKKRLRK